MLQCPPQCPPYRLEGPSLGLPLHRGQPKLLQLMAPRLQRVQQLVLQCLAKDPADRPMSAFELEERLATIAFSDEWDGQSAAVWWQESLKQSLDIDPVRPLSDTTQINPGDTE